ncbi:hypothetical protein HGO38_24340 [Rhizobium sp. CG5]|nr:hypothetical protein [Rhizobium sp. CG5]
MTRTGCGLALALSTFAGASLLPAKPAAAVVYCKTVGVPKGCVARPTAVVVYCTRPGYPVGCAARRPAAVAVPGVGAPGVGVRGVPGNRGGPVNRVGVR